MYEWLNTFEVETAIESNGDYNQKTMLREERIKEERETETEIKKYEKWEITSRKGSREHGWVRDRDGEEQKIRRSLRKKGGQERKSERGRVEDQP